MIEVGTVARVLGIGSHAGADVPGDPSQLPNIAVTHSLNIPSESVQGTATAGDNVTVTATTDDGDGATTSGVQLFNGVTLLGSFTGGPTSWSYALNGVTVGTYILIARRVTNQGTVDSVPHALVVSAPSAGSGTIYVESGGDDRIDVESTTGVIDVES